MSKAKKRPRAAVRQSERSLEKLGHKLDRLVLQAPGGSPDKAIAVSSASVVEVKARSFRCGRCEGELLLLSHEAEFLGGNATTARGHAVSRLLCSPEGVVFLRAGTKQLKA